MNPIFIFLYILAVLISLAITYVYMKKRASTQFKRLGEKVPEETLKKMEKEGVIEKINGKSNIKDRI